MSCGNKIDAPVVKRKRHEVKCTERVKADTWRGEPLRHAVSDDGRTHMRAADEAHAAESIAVRVEGPLRRVDERGVVRKSQVVRGCRLTFETN